jgi:hypothetical protein
MEPPPGRARGLTPAGRRLHPELVHVASGFDRQRRAPLDEHEIDTRRRVLSPIRERFRPNSNDGR